jgi:DNA-binding NarL/FixJ family response regulator
MEFTVELRYRSGSSTVMSTEADTADEALHNVRDERRPLVGIHITAPGMNGQDAPREHREQSAPTFRRAQVQHRPSRRRR